MEDIPNAPVALSAKVPEMKECASARRVCRGKSEEILAKLQAAFPKSAGRFKMVSGSAHSYVVYKGDKEQLFIDPTISQFTGEPANVFVGTLADLKPKVGTKIDNYFEYDGRVPVGGRRKTRRRSKPSKAANAICMKKSVYLREHHHLFKVLRNHTRRALNAELRAQKRELKERGLK